MGESITTATVKIGRPDSEHETGEGVLLGTVNGVAVYGWHGESVTVRIVYEPMLDEDADRVGR